MENPDPVRPKTLSPLAEAMLEELAKHPESSEIVLGGGIALKHYVDFRETVDVDAWWVRARSDSALTAIEKAAGSVADAFGLRLDRRKFGSTESFEYKIGENKKEFSFQISERDVTLDNSLPSAWSPIKIETFRDNVGSKMNALVDRGAPRDLVDIHTVVGRGLVSLDECWRLWQMKNPGLGLDEAKTKVLAHIDRLEQRRPLSDIPAEDRASADRLRSWYRQEFARLDFGSPGV